MNKKTTLQTILLGTTLLCVNALGNGYISEKTEFQKSEINEFSDITNKNSVDEYLSEPIDALKTEKNNLNKRKEVIIEYAKLLDYSSTSLELFHEGGYMRNLEYKIPMFETRNGDIIKLITTEKSLHRQETYKIKYDLINSKNPLSPKEFLNDYANTGYNKDWTIMDNEMPKYVDGVITEIIPLRNGGKK